MPDDCFKNENLIRQEYDSIYIMMGTNDIRHNKYGMRAAKKLVKRVKQSRKQKPHTNIKILEIPHSQTTTTKRNLINLTINKEAQPK